MKTTFKNKRPKTGGRKKGTKNKSTVLFQNLLLEERIGLLKEAIKMALAGNAAIMNKLLDKILPSITAKEDDGDEDKDSDLTFEGWTDGQLDSYIEKQNKKIGYTKAGVKDERIN